MRKSPFFSIIIPTYERPIELERAIHSVLAQSYTDFEVIVVNNSERTIELKLEDERVTYIQEIQKGANYARNKGIANSVADFICFLDDDDEYLPNHLQVLFDLIKSNQQKEALYKTYARIEKADGTLFDQHDPIKPIEMNNLQYIFLYPIYMNCVCIHKNILKNYLFDPKVKVAQDYDLWIRILAKVELIIAPIVTNIYHFTQGSTSKATKEKYYNYIELYSKYFNDPFYGKLIPETVKKERLFKYYFWLLCEFKKELQLKEKLIVLKRIILYKPKILFETTLYGVLLKP